MKASVETLRLPSGSGRHWVAMAALRPVAAVLGALASAALLIALAGANPLAAYRAMALGAFGSVTQAMDGVVKATPYLLCATGIALCFRGRIINIGADGQIACGAMAATAAAQAWPHPSPLAGCLALLLAGAIGGAAWAGLAALLHLGRRPGSHGCCPSRHLREPGVHLAAGA